MVTLLLQDNRHDPLWDTLTLLFAKGYPCLVQSLDDTIVFIVCAVTNDQKLNSIYSLVVYMDHESGHSFTGSSV